MPTVRVVRMAVVMAMACVLSFVPVPMPVPRNFATKAFDKGFHKPQLGLVQHRWVSFDRRDSRLQDLHLLGDVHPCC
jgi:hypothetical protein